MTTLAVAMLRRDSIKITPGLLAGQELAIVLERSFYNEFVHFLFGEILNRLLMPRPIAAHGEMIGRDLRWSSMMTAAQQGDGQAYKALLEECVPHIRKVAHAVGVTDDRVDDVVQEALITVHRARHTFDPKRNFTAWLNAIARHRSIDELRDRHRHHKREIHEPDAYAGHIDEAAAPDQLYCDQVAGGHLRKAITTLTVDQREAIEALGLREQSLEETARETGKTKGALKVNFHRALKALRQRLERNV